MIDIKEAKIILYQLLNAKGYKDLTYSEMQIKFQLSMDNDLIDMQKEQKGE